MTTTTTEAANAWVIRPVTVLDERRYVAVAILASGEEVEIYDCLVAFRSVRDARLAIITKFDGGRRFPKPAKPRDWSLSAGYLAEVDAIRDRYRTA